MLTALVVGRVSAPDAAAQPGTAAGRAAGPECVEQVLSGLSLAQRVGQLFVGGVSSTAPTAAQLDMIRRHSLGGVIMMGNSTAGAAATRAVTDRLNAQATTTDGVRLWIATDQEGGRVQRLKGPGFSTIPTALEQGKLSPQTLETRARTWAGELRAAGVNLNLAPVLDTVPADIGRDNPPIGAFDRQYGDTPEAVTSHGTAYDRGMRSAGVQTSGKHFPGLGRVFGNTDTEPDVTDTVTTRNDAYVGPFRAAAAGGASMIMVSSARYTRIDSGAIAAFSATVQRGMIRGDLGYDGVIISDDLGAAAAVESVPVGQRALRFLSAGGTVVLTVDDATVATMVAAVVQRANTDAAFAGQVTAAARTVLTTKDTAGLLPC